MFCEFPIRRLLTTRSISPNRNEEMTSLKELAGLFTRLGLTAFGGPAAHIAMMQKEVVDKRKWMDHRHFLDLIGAINLIPGPNSTENVGLALIGVGCLIASFAGLNEIAALFGAGFTVLLFTAGNRVRAVKKNGAPLLLNISFISATNLQIFMVFLPSFLLVAVLNPLVPRMRKSVSFAAFLDGVNVASVALIAVVYINFTRESVHDWRTMVIAAVSTVVVFGFSRVNTVFILVGAALAGYGLQMI
jgi:chromate transport protein ChrA